MISKTDYLLYRECSKNAWLKIHRPDLYYANELSDFEKSIIETGNEVESLARKLFPTGILIDGRDIIAQEKTSVIIQALTKETSAANDADVQSIFQPVFVKSGFMAAIDLLQYSHKSKSFTLYEIKATNALKEKTHLYDLAYQVNLLKMCGLNIDEIKLLHLNPKYVRNGDLDLLKLFATDDVTQLVNELLESVMDEMQAALSFLTSEEEPLGHCSCIYKGRSSHCTSFKHWNPGIPEYSVHDIARIGVSKAKLTELIDGNIFDVGNIPEEIELSEIQKNQVDVHISGRPIIKKDSISRELSSLQFPLYFIDYETYPSAVPRFDGFSPYQQIPFQYSLHIIEKAGDLMSSTYKPLHQEFLHTGSNDPTGPFLESLMKNIGKIGSVIVWNKKFECKINDELAKRVASLEIGPNARKFIDDVNGRVYDLMDIFSKQHYVHKGFQGSTSIKYVLPVIAEIAGGQAELSYKKLAIREGGTASMKWNEMSTGMCVNEKTGEKSTLSAEDRKQIAQDLLKYCALDTYAMYAIWKHLWELCK